MTNTACYHFYVEPKKQNKLVTITKMEQGHRYRDKLVLIHGVGVMEEGQQQKGIQREKYYVQNKL